MHSTTCCKEISYLIHTHTCPHTKPRYTTHTRLALAISKKETVWRTGIGCSMPSISSLAEPVPVPWKPQTTPAFIVLILQLNRRRRSRDTSPPLFRGRSRRRGKRSEAGGRDLGDPPGFPSLTHCVEKQLFYVVARCCEVDLFFSFCFCGNEATFHVPFMKLACLIGTTVYAWQLGAFFSSESYLLRKEPFPCAPCLDLSLPRAFHLFKFI